MSLTASRAALVVAVLLALSATAWVILRVDLEPRVESDFFFSTDDPQLRSTERIAELFPTAPQVLVSATAADITASEYIAAVGELSDELAALAGVTAVQSLTRGPPSPGSVAESPLWKRLLLGQDPRSSLLVVSLDEAAGGAVARAIEEVVERHHRPSFALEISGVPYVLELIRQHLLRDLRLFTGTAFVIFGFLVTLVYRSLWIMTGTLTTCLAAGVTTLATLDLLGTPIGLLTANIVTIVFVLTLSHIVFLTANWRAEHERRGTAADRDEIVARAWRLTLTASFWCMVTTFLGFSSLLFASAKPLRELGMSGAVGAAAAIAFAYALYPAFLRLVPAPAARRWWTAGRERGSRRAWGGGVAVIAVVTLVAALGVTRIETDPSLLDYFAPADEIRPGLELIDASGGSSPLLLVVRDGGEKLDSNAAVAKLERLQQALEAEGDVGTALSLPVLLAEARRFPLARLLPYERLLDFLETDAYREATRAFVTEDRRSALFFLRMREAGRQEERRAIVERLAGEVERAGLEVAEVGGLYELQGKLGELVASSLVGGLGALFALFVLIAALVARRARVAMTMVLSLLAVPLLLLGSLGHLGVPLDVISSPAANVAIALGIDSMIHLVMAVRRRVELGDAGAHAWRTAVGELWGPILGATLILAAGFGIFSLSSFPPTQRFGVMVAGGTLVAAIMALLVLPFLATLGKATAGEVTPKGETVS